MVRHITFLTCVATLAIVGQCYVDYFAALGVPHGASENEVKKAYKKLVRTLHPDAVEDHERENARKRFREVTEAYEILSDAEKRAQYESGRRPHSSNEDRQYLRYHLFQEFDGVELRDTEMQNVANGKADAAHVVFFWSSNFPDCIDYAPPFKQLATRMRGTSVTVASFKCDDDPMMCRRLALPNLPAIKLFASGKTFDFEGKIEVVALTNFAAKFLNSGITVQNSSAPAILSTCPNAYPALAEYGVAGNFIWQTTKKSHVGVMDFGLVALEYSPCFDCETALHLALETVSPVLSDLHVRRVDCRRLSNADLCDPYREKNRAWTLATLQRRCWYATKKPYTFSDEFCEPLEVRQFQGKYANEPLVNFIVAHSKLRGAKRLNAARMQELKKSNDSWVVLFDDADSLDVSHRVQWFLLARSINHGKPVQNSKGFRLRASIVNCVATPSLCASNHPRPYVALYGYGTKVKSAEPTIYGKVAGWKSMMKDIVRDADPLHLHVLTPKNYDKKINGGMQKGKTWFVLFNAGQWCPPCNQIRQPWKDATRLVQNSPQRKKLAFAIVECDTHKQLCNQLGIQNYPSMLYFAKGRPRAEYPGARDGHEIAKWGIDQLDNRLQTLHPGDLNGRIQRGETVLVSFTAGAWCPPCTALAPVMKKVSNLLDKAMVVSFNCDENGHFCHSFGVEGFPTVILFTNGRRHQFEAYQKTEHQMAAWAKQFL